MKNTVVNCDKEFFEFYVNREIFNTKRTFAYLLDYAPKHRYDKGDSNIEGVEIIVRPECNQKCEYCYVARYGHDLYPVPERVDNAQLLSNLRSLLHYIFIEKDTYMNHFELFAGDLFYDNLYFDVLDVFYEFLEPLYKEYPMIFKANEGLILTPTNFSFIEDQAKVDRFDEYVAKFRALNWDVGLSISTDGKYAIDTRENRPLDDAYFEKLFEFTLKYPRVGFHPILSASNIHNAIKNYEWWRDMYDKYYGAVRPDDDEDTNRDFLPYWLEARNDEWTDETIDHFINMLDFMIEDRLKMCDNNPDAMAYHLFCGDGKNGTKKKMYHPDYLNIICDPTNPREQIGCSISGLFCITLNNLAVVPCHRTTYLQFRGGEFERNEQNEIIGLKPGNVATLINAKMLPATSAPQCVFCAYLPLCRRGCLGAQFESTGELFQPCVSVCKLSKAYLSFICWKYESLGILRSAQRQGLISDIQFEYYSNLAQNYKNAELHKKVERRKFS